MTSHESPYLHLLDPTPYQDATLVLAFSGWMDGGDVSTGTVQQLVDLLAAEPIGHIDPEPFYIYNFPGTMEMTALFRPHIEIESGLIRAVEMPANEFYGHRESNLILFLGKEPNLRWQTFGRGIFEFAETMGVGRVLFVGSVGGSVPHTREPNLFVTCSDEQLLEDMEEYGVGRTDYEGPGSFTSYLMTQASSLGLPMVSIVAEIPAYLQGTNPMSIEAVTRRLAKILDVRVDFDAMRTASTEWEFEVSNSIEADSELADKVRELEEEYDNKLLEDDAESS